MKMSPEMMWDFMNLGYTAESGFNDGIFYGVINRFGVFCNGKTGEVTYEMIKIHLFKDNLAGFRKLYGKLDKDDQYHKYPATANGDPILNEEKIKSTRFSL